MDINAIKLPEGLPTQPTEAQAPAATDTAPTDTAVSKPEGQPTPTAAPTEKPVWDGDESKLDPALQEQAKAMKRYFTKTRMAEADLRKEGEEYRNFKNSEDYKAFQEWKSGAAASPINPTVTPQNIQQAQITSQEWEEAQLDASGTKFNSLVDRIVQQKIEQAAKVYGMELQQMKSQQQSVQWQTALSDFADINPDVVELHEMGLMKPYLEEAIKSGQYKTNEAALNAAYEKAAEIRSRIKADALKASQGRVAEKRDATVYPGISTGAGEVVFVDNKKDAFDQAISLALDNKKAKVKVKK